MAKRILPFFFGCLLAGALAFFLVRQSRGAGGSTAGAFTWVHWDQDFINTYTGGAGVIWARPDPHVSKQADHEHRP